MKENKMVLIAYAMLVFITLLSLACSPTRPDKSETLKRIAPPKFTFSEVLKRAVKTKQMPDDAMVDGDTSKMSRIIFNGLGAQAGDALAFVYVSPSGDDSNDGSSWAKAKKKIGGALNGITDATDTKRYIVLIGAGAYSPSASLSLKNYVALIGGFEASSDEETRYDRRGTTTISGKNDKQVFKNENLDTPSKSTAVLAGVTIAKGTGESGGGMYNNKSSPTVSHTTFSGNKATGTNGSGGGMYNNKSSPTVSHITFSENTATKDGGGMYNSSSSPMVSHITFSQNTVGGSGGGMYNYDSSPTVNHATFFGNKTKYWGGGMTNSKSSSPTVEHTTFSRNTASSGGGMYNSDNSSPTVSHVTFFHNEADYGGGMLNSSSSPTVSHTTFSGNKAIGANGSGGGMRNSKSSLPVVSSSIFWGNTKGTTFDQIDNNNSTPVVAHSIVQGGYAAGTSIIHQNSLLEALTDNGGFVKTMALKAGSRAINNGLYFARKGGTNYYSKDGSTWYTKPTLSTGETTNLLDAVRDDTDARGYGYDGLPDIGAYEYGGTAP